MGNAWREIAITAMQMATASVTMITKRHVQRRCRMSIPLLAALIDACSSGSPTLLDERHAHRFRAGCESHQCKDGVDDGTRTHDGRNHNPGLYQLSYVHHCSGAPGRTRTCDPRLRRPMLYPAELRARSRSNNSRRVEMRPRGCRSGRGERIRTSDPLLPKQMRY